ncbi:MAG: hypothetical protein JW795_06330 [Chitinivibrionales bacterium]|nr:hypothetical protein [Chitinivibrionales bacterium]
MKIAQSDISFQSASITHSFYRKKESLHIWQTAADRTTDATTESIVKKEDAIHDRVTLSQTAQSLQRATSFATASTALSSDSATGKSNQPSLTKKISNEILNDTKLTVIKALIEQMTGKEIRIYSGPQSEDQESVDGTIDDQSGQSEGSESQPSPLQGWGLSFSSVEESYENEEVQFHATGSAVTQDGVTIQFDTSLLMKRETYTRVELSLKAGDALIDPLIISFDNAPASLEDTKFQFDLNNDSVNDSVSFLRPGSGFLALDANANGHIDNGSELFGPSSGNGFQELAAYDDDGNNWIDENDSIYFSLRIWRKSNDSDTLSTLAENKIGALYLGKSATPFSLQNSSASLTGAIRETGLYLKENGQTGFIQEIDIAV